MRCLSCNVSIVNPRGTAQHSYCVACLSAGRDNLKRFGSHGKDASVATARIHGVNPLLAALQTGALNMLNDKEFVTLQQVSKSVREAGIMQLLAHASKSVKHFDKKTPSGVDVTADEMLEIAILAYHGALEVTQNNKPIILYRVTDKGALTEVEKQQTLSGRIRVKTNYLGREKEVWPLEKTAAWIQGAMRAKARFLLLSDPREGLLGGRDGTGDAVYVRELHQILSSNYIIAEASDDDLTDRMRRASTRAFILKPRIGTLNFPVPIIPKMSGIMQGGDTWDGSVSTLRESDPNLLVRNTVRASFVSASSKLGGVPKY